MTEEPRIGKSSDDDELDVPNFVELNDLASNRINGRILFAIDDWFAVAENLLKPEPAVWKEDAFTECGKWMDGWESRRKRTPGHDWCVIKLGIPGEIHGLDVDTSYFTGNYAPNISVQAACLEDDSTFPKRTSVMGSAASKEAIEAMDQLATHKWEEIVPFSKLGPGYKRTCHNYLGVTSRERWTHLRLNMYPDGGIARLRVYGQAQPVWSTMDPCKLVDLVAMENGGVCVGYSDAHYGHPRNLLTKPRSLIMADGWETARRLDRPSILEEDENHVLKINGWEWSVFRLGHSGIIREIEIDTNHFKGNYPDSCSVEGCVLSKAQEVEMSSRREGKARGDFSECAWKVILPTSKLSAHQQHFFEKSVRETPPVTHARLIMRPDGGISRMRLWGELGNL